MPRLPLRAKTGCDRCKIRKKKCDETYPVCTACQRLGLNCSWTPGALPRSSRNEQDTLAQSSHEQAAPVAWSLVRVPMTRDLHRQSEVVSSQSEFNWTQTCIRFFRLAPRDKKSSDEVVSTICRLASGSQMLTRALSTFAIYTRLTLGKEIGLLDPCAESYNRTIVALNRQVGAESQGDISVVLAFTIGMMALMECHVFMNVENASQHLAMSLQLWPQAIQMSGGNREILRMAHLNVEGGLFQLATVSNFLDKARIDDVVSKIRWHSIDLFFTPPLLIESYGCHLSPHYGLHYRIYRLVLEINYASRRRVVTQGKLQSWLLDLESLEMLQPAFYRHVPIRAAEIGLTLSNLFFCGLRIYIRKLVSPTACSSDSTVRQLAAHGLGLLKQDIMKAHFDLVLFWPMLLLLFALRDRDDVGWVANFGRGFSKNAGYARLWLAAVNEGTKSRSLDPCGEGHESCRGHHDGLEILFRSDGIIMPEVDNFRSVYRSLCGSDNA